MPILSVYLLEYYTTEMSTESFSVQNTTSQVVF